MPDLSVSLPESTFAVALVSISIDEQGQPSLINATEFPIEDLAETGRKGLPTALRRLAETIEKDLAGAEPTEGEE